MENIDRHTYDLILGHLCGENSAERDAELRAWVEESEEHARLMRDVREICFSATTPDELSRYDSERAWLLFQRRVAAAQSGVKAADAGDDDESSAEVYVLRWLKYAVAVAAAVILLVVAFRQGQHSVNVKLAKITVEAPAGSHTKTTLPDGTVAWLNAGSVLSYSQGYGLRDREVTLTGEGCFEVLHDDSRPFRVSTQTMEVNDVGTRFNVKDYPRDTEAEVVLESGEVSVENKMGSRRAVGMNAGQRAVIDKRTGRMHLDGANAAVVTEWTTGRIAFRGDSLGMIAQKLSRAYGTEIQVDPRSHNAGRFYGVFARQENSLYDVINALASTHKMGYRRQGKTIILY